MASELTLFVEVPTKHHRKSVCSKAIDEWVLGSAEAPSNFGHVKGKAHSTQHTTVNDL